MAAEDPVNDVNRRFYEAFESLDLKRMEGIWLREDYIKCVHPGWALLTGWDAVMESWKRIFENTQQMRFALTDVRVQVQGGLAWVTLYENLNSTLEGQTNAAVVLTTNIYEERPEGWFMIHHHGSPVMMRQPEPHPTVQ
ncbi:MAG: nuclear transport factor 2 family protein [Deltaproteobacteria bacterium]|nr:nuclear transport factor 2 family protein [Deltaproteobacteria bacterium]